MIRRVETLLLAWAMLLGVVSCRRDMPNSASVTASGAELPYSGEGFCLVIPGGVRVEKAEPADYIRYTFTSDGQNILDAYVGNQPNLLFDDPAVGPESITQLNGLPCKRIQAQKADGSVRNEVLIRFPRSYGWPMNIHFWYGLQRPENRSLAETIIASIQPQVQGTQLSPSPDNEGSDFLPTPLNTQDTAAEAEAEQISPKERERRQREDERAIEEADEFVIAGMEEDLEKMKREQGMTDEVKQWEASIKKAKEELRLLKEEHCKARDEREKNRGKAEK